MGIWDAVTTNLNFPVRVWFNDGNARFSSGAELSSGRAEGLALGDIDGDGDLDLFVARRGPNIVWLNDGKGAFVAGPTVGSSDSFGVSLGDLDGDGDLDAFVANRNSADRVWINNGDAEFAQGSFDPDNFPSLDVRLGDFDNDQDLDAFVVSMAGAASAVWLNDGSGDFLLAEDQLGVAAGFGLGLGDVDADGDLDVIVANNGPDELWINQTSFEAPFSYELSIVDLVGKRRIVSGTSKVDSSATQPIRIVNIDFDAATETVESLRIIEDGIGDRRKSRE